eukprot:scaffold138581_cov27-Tisochrysis_lutea.AAC.3
MTRATLKSHPVSQDRSTRRLATASSNSNVRDDDVYHEHWDWVEVVSTLPTTNGRAPFQCGREHLLGSDRVKEALAR